MESTISLEKNAREILIELSAIENLLDGPIFEQVMFEVTQQMVEVASRIKQLTKIPPQEGSVLENLISQIKIRTREVSTKLNKKKLSKEEKLLDTNKKQIDKTNKQSISANFIEQQPKHRRRSSTDFEKPKKMGADSDDEEKVILKQRKKTSLDPNKEWFLKSKLEANVKLENGFYDTGKNSNNALNALPPLDFLKEKQFSLDIPEILVFNSTQDPVLFTLIQRTEEICGYIADKEVKAKMIALLIGNSMGGSPVSNFDIPLKSREYIINLRQQSKKNILNIGEISIGSFRHRALLFKYLSDKMGLASSLTRTMKLLYYNSLTIGGKELIVDLVHNCGSLYPENSELGKAYVSLEPEACEKLEWKNQNEGKLTKRYLSHTDLKEAPLEKMEQLGKGGFGSVWRCNLSGFTVAVKLFQFSDSMTSSSKKKIMKEVELLQKLEHPNIVAYLGHEITPDSIYLFMEYLPRSLFEVIKLIQDSKRKPFSLSEISNSSIQILKALQYMHNLPDKVIHRDLKSKNVLVELNENSEIKIAKLCDLGVSKELTETTIADTIIGTTRWCAPEVVSFENKSKSYDEKVDIWSFGMILYEMITLQMPFQEIELFEVRNHVLQGNLPTFNNISTNLLPIKNSILHCLEFEPTKRPNATDCILSFIKI